MGPNRKEMEYLNSDYRRVYLQRDHYKDVCKKEQSHKKGLCKNLPR